MREFYASEIAAMTELRDKGKSFRAIGRAIGCGREAAQMALHNAPKQPKPAPLNHSGGPKASTIKHAKDSLVYGSVMHLVDIKRAGHFSRWAPNGGTEYNIPPDGSTGARLTTYSDIHGSLTGSSAGLCANERGFD